MEYTCTAEKKYSLQAVVSQKSGRVQKRSLEQEGFGPDTRTQTSLVHAAFFAFMHKDNHLLHWTLTEKAYYKQSKEN